MLSSETENRTIQPKIESPPVEVFRPLEKFPLVDSAGNVCVEICLKRTLDKFNADDPPVGIPFIQPADDFQLTEMLIVSIVFFANEDRARPRDVGDDSLDIALLPAAVVDLEFNVCPARRKSACK
jgi:hypothetical protein